MNHVMLIAILPFSSEDWLLLKQQPEKTIFHVVPMDHRI
jgi:hypothetical protein